MVRLERPVDKSPPGNNAFTGMKTLRTSALIRKSKACGALAMSPLVMSVIDRVLGPQCARFQLSFSQAISIGAGERAQAIHRDSSKYPFKRPVDHRPHSKPSRSRIARNSASTSLSLGRATCAFTAMRSSSAITRHRRLKTSTSFERAATSR